MHRYTQNKKNVEEKNRQIHENRTKAVGLLAVTTPCDDSLNEQVETRLGKKLGEEKKWKGPVSSQSLLNNK